MRVCTAGQMAQIDRETIAGGIPGEKLMERAGQVLSAELLDFLEENLADDHHQGGCCGGGKDGDHDHDRPGVLIICGKGNNGGDGLVMARLLAEQDLLVTVMLLHESDRLSTDARLNFDRLPDKVNVVTPAADRWAETFRELAEDATVMVDAIFGTGIAPPVRGAYPDLFRSINDEALPCLAVDIPSGVCGNTGRVDPVAVSADLTVTIGLPKLGLLLEPGRGFTESLQVEDIGFPEEIVTRHTGDLRWWPRDRYLSLLPPRPGDVHKYRCGRLLVVAGSRDFGGAAHLAGMGGLRSGAGLVTLAVPRNLETATRVLLPEAVTRAVDETSNGTLAPLAGPAWEQLASGQQALAVGPGLGTDSDTDRWIVAMLANLALPAVVDADALNAFARSGADMKFGSDQVVLTPHPGELARLTGLSAEEISSRRLDLPGELAARWKAVVVLKGAPTMVGLPDGRVFINFTGDDTLARGGSGDVLTGLIGGLLAQGLTAPDAALLGVYVHGLAGEKAATGQSNRSALVREIAASIGPVFEEMEKEASLTADLRERIWPVTPRDRD